MFAQDLERFPLEDIEAGLGKIGLRPREEGETAFPDMGTMLHAIKIAGRDRRIADAKARPLRLYHESTEDIRPEIDTLLKSKGMGNDPQA